MRKFFGFIGARGKRKEVDEETEENFPRSLLSLCNKEGLPELHKVAKKRNESGRFPYAEKYHLGFGIFVFIESQINRRYVQLSAHGVQKAVMCVPITHITMMTNSNLNIVSKNVLSQEDKELGPSCKSFLGAYEDNTSTARIYSFTSPAIDLPIEKIRIQSMLQKAVRHELAHHIYARMSAFIKNGEITPNTLTEELNTLSEHELASRIKRSWGDLLNKSDKDLEEEFAETYAEFWHPNLRKKLKRNHVDRYSFMKEIFSKV